MRPLTRYVSRRALISGSLCAALAIKFDQPLWASANTTPLTKPIGQSAESLPVIGLGTDAFDKGDYTAIRAEIKRMVAMGGTVIDTAADYGQSEAVIGRVLAELNIRDKVFLATKLTEEVGTGGSHSVGQASFEQSLARLQTNHVDLLQVHNLNGVESLMPTLRQWKKDGRVRYLGITTANIDQHADMAAYMRKLPLDFVQVDYSIAARDAEIVVLPLAQERKIAVIANFPFGYGSLIRRAGLRPLPPFAAELGISSWAQFFLKYVISHPAITCVIPGSTKVAHLEDNQQAGYGQLPNTAQRQAMETYWQSFES
jgi:aryl-alcohol dehydrogenase-like predicted oxidoreductase